MKRKSGNGAALAKAEEEPWDLVDLTRHNTREAILELRWEPSVDSTQQQVLAALCLSYVSGKMSLTCSSKLPRRTCPSSLIAFSARNCAICSCLFSSLF